LTVPYRGSAFTLGRVLVTPLLTSARTDELFGENWTSKSALVNYLPRSCSGKKEKFLLEENIPIKGQLNSDFNIRSSSKDAD